MYGYTITINGSTQARQGDICHRNNVCSNHMLHKFERDKLFAENENFIILLDGVILNRIELITQYHRVMDDSQWLNTIIQLYRERGDEFFSVLRGSYSGALYDKSADKWIIFCDHVGSKYTYYAKVGDFFCCGEEMGQMYQLLRDNKITYHLSTENAFLLLTYGFMLDDRTLCEEIHKINPGCYIVFQNGQVLEKRYYLLNNQPNENIHEKEAVEVIDYYFRQAITRQFEKDKEYGYKHIVSLSGGLDCRMTTFVAHDCGYTQQLNMTFSQTDYWDQTLPMHMSAYLKHEWIFKSLDNGIWLYDIEDITRTTGGNVLYYGTAHGNSLYKYLNFDNFGLLHTGQIGDVIIGSFVNNNDKEDEYILGGGAYSTKYLSKLEKLSLSLNVKKELGMLYYRGLHGANNGIQNVYNYTETLSPFLDLDVLENVLHIPIKLRQNHTIYKKWILTKYPQASRFEWETTGQKIDVPTFRVRNKEIPWANIPKSIKAHVRMALGMKASTDSMKSMNPVAFYLSHNNDLRKYLDDYFKYVDAIPNNELRSIIYDIHKNGTAMEKIEAVSLLCAIKLFFV